MSPCLDERGSLPRDGLAIVAGGSGAIGAAVCGRLASIGLAVCVHYATDDVGAKAVVSQIEAARGVGFAVQADLRDVGGCRALFDEACKRSGPLRILVNCAGVLHEAPLPLLRDELIVDTLTINTLAAIRSIQLAARQMTRAGGGAIVNVGSLSSSNPLMGQTAYATSKAALGGLTRAAALELARFHISVNLVEPGPIRGEGMLVLGRAELATRQLPIGAPPSAQDVADAVAFLCSQRACAITGETIRVDGALGRTTSWFDLPGARKSRRLSVASRTGTAGT